MADDVRLNDCSQSVLCMTSRDLVRYRRRNSPGTRKRPGAELECVCASRYRASSSVGKPNKDFCNTFMKFSYIKIQQISLVKKKNYIKGSYIYY